MLKARNNTVYRNIPNKQAGSSLLEALVAIVLFSVGLIGLISVQGRAVSLSADAKYRADAAFLANQIAGQMQSDTSTLSSINEESSTTLSAWQADVAQALPQGSGSVAVAAPNVTVQINWTPPQSPNTQKSFTLVTTIPNNRP